MNQSKFHIVAACTDRKRHQADPEALLRAVPGGRPLRSIAADWWGRLSSSNAALVPARDLYAGEHWSTVLRLPELARRYKAQLWVASAGYGLIQADSKVASYGATFAQGSPDSITNLDCDSLGGDELLQGWWAELAKKRLKGQSGPRTISKIVQQDKKATVMIVAGPRYVTSMLLDIQEALGHISDANHLIVVTLPQPKLTVALEDNLIPSTSKLWVKGDGTLGALHARVAAKILTDHRTLRASNLRKKYLSLLEKLPLLPRPERPPMTDEQVRAFVRRQLKKVPGQRHSPMLRVLRDDKNRGCEQARFKRLHSEVEAGELDG